LQPVLQSDERIGVDAIAQTFSPSSATPAHGSSMTRLGSAAESLPGSMSVVAPRAPTHVRKRRRDRSLVDPII
jgi:hypothetical protein